MCRFKSYSLVFLFFTSIIFHSCSNDPVSSDNAEESKNTTSLFTKLSPTVTGIDFRNDLIDDPLNDDHNVMSFQHYFNGGGVAVGDLNNDGLDDIIFSGNETKNRIYINKGDFKFEDVTEKSGINKGKRWTTGVSLADVNNDGFLDIYFCQSSPNLKPADTRKNLLFINNKNLTFDEKAQEYGLADTNYGEQAVFFDMDKDGDLDCYVLNNSIYTRLPLEKVHQHLKVKANLEAASSNMYRNDNGKFIKITEAAGMLKQGFGLGVMTADLNDDGLLDIYQANDYSVPDFMYINQGDGTFKDEVNSRTKQLSWFSMGMDIADINNDGFTDIGVVDMAATDHIRGKTLMAPMNANLFYFGIKKLGHQRQHMFNVMQINNGDGTYNNMAGLTNLLSSEWSWAALFADFDNDGWKDFFVANGFRRYSRDNDSRIRMEKIRQEYGGSIPNEKRKELYNQIPQVKIPNYVYHNKGSLEFEEVGDQWGLGDPSYSNGAAYGDFDNDGDLDLIVNNISDFAFVYQNNAQKNNNHYLKVNLKSNLPKEGTKVKIWYGDEIQLLEYSTIRGFQSAISPTLHFGLGKTSKIDRLEVTWPNGKTEEMANVKVDQTLTLDLSQATGNKKTPSPKKAFFAKKNQSIFTHKENEYNDFAREVLVPYQQSTLGPFIGKGDVNNDGLDDFYVGGAKGQSGQLFMQNKSGKFTAASSQPWNTHKNSEDMGSHFFDADGDKDLDLYIISGGNDFDENASELQDRLYLNNGKGVFSFAKNSLPKIQHGGSRVKSADIDGDGDLDLLVGGRLIPKKYPSPARSYLLLNEKGTFKDVTAEWSADLVAPGLVNDFEWTDLNGDQKLDLVVLGEWMPIQFFENTGNAFTNTTDKYMKKPSSGWWYNIHQADIDNDGDQDFIVGNLGLNSKFHASEKKPFSVLANDFDKNGTLDVVLTKDYKGKKVPVRGRECSSEQMPFIAEKFATYNDFAHASVEDILGEESINESVSLSVNNFESGILRNNGGTYSFEAFPRFAQAFPAMGIETKDLNKDGYLDIILAGNIYNMEIETPRLDAGEGLILMGGQNGFTISTAIENGFRAPKDVKDICMLKTGNDQSIIIVANNNGPLEIFQTVK